MRVQPWLCFQGIEILNDLRTLTYMRRGLLGVPQWSVSLAAGSVTEGGYVDAYTDEYTADPYWPGNLQCYCEILDESSSQTPGGYVSPADDPAPWYTSARPESNEFLGLLLIDCDIPPTFSRTVAPSPSRGGVAGRLLPKQRVMSVSAIMYASTDRGMAYGERWLADVLAGNQCDPLSDLGDLEILPSCPDTVAGGRYSDTYSDIYLEDPVDPATFFRTLKRTGIADGPTPVPLGQTRGSIPECNAQRVEFTLVSELPWLFSPAVEIADAPIGAGGSLSGQASTAEWVGDAGVRLTITAGASGFEGTVSATPMVAGQTCATAGTDPAYEYGISVDAENTWVFDSATRQLQGFDITSKAWVSGMSSLSIPDGGFSWLEIPPCSDVCITVTCSSGGGDVLIEQINREL